MPRLLALLGALALPAVAGAQRAAPAATSKVARFDWFTYEGHDSVYRVMRAGPREYLNPVVAGFYPDPSVVRKGDDYYLVTSSFAYFPGVPIFHSRDLVRWTQLGHVLDRPSQLEVDGVGISRGIFAPVIREHAGTFYMITTNADRGNFIVTATNPAGPWSEPVWLPELRDAIDPSLFFDDDGAAYVVNNGPPQGAPLYEGHRAIWVQRFDVGSRKMVGPRAVIVNGGVDIAKRPIWIEAPHIVKHGGRYYLICAEGGTADQHSEVVFRGDRPMGPYVPGPVNPILTQRHLDPSRPFPITSAGHADFVDTPNGETWAVFLGVRPYGDNLYNTGRETFLLPVRWVDGWPVILQGNATVPYVARRPDLPAGPAPKIPTAGNFVVHEDFSGRSLAPYWTSIRTPREPFHDLTSRPGWLSLRARPAALGTMTQLSFIGRRQQHAEATVSTAMTYTPTAPGDAAGLVAFETDDNNLFLGVTLAGGKPVVQLVERAGPARSGAPSGAQNGAPGGGAKVLASAPLATAGGPVYLRIAAHGARYDFFYGTVRDRWIPLATGVDGTILSTRRAGGFSSNFVGVVFGMYAHSAAP